MLQIRAIIKFILFALLCLMVIFFQCLLLFFYKGRHAYTLPFLWQKTVCWIFAIKVQVNGVPSRDKQTLFVSNHVSYLDIPAIGSVIKGSFIAKKDVKGWPVFGFLSKLQQTIFISRDRADAEKGKNQLDEALTKGKSLIVFPEGTSTEGVAVLPFKSSLFVIAMQDNAKDLHVQPITVKIEQVSGALPQSQEDRDSYAWHINMDTPLGEHLWQFAQSKGAVISLNFHPAVRANEFENRKTLAKHCHNAVSNGLRN